MKEKNERELLTLLHNQTVELRQKAWSTKNYKKSIATRRKEQKLYEKYLLLKGIREAKQKTGGKK